MRAPRRLVGLLAVALVASLTALVPAAGAQEGSEPAVDPVDVTPLAADTDDIAPQGGDVAAAAGAVSLRGRGWGHGRGLGQYGSLGYAVDFGWPYERIVDHFYGSTEPGTVPDRQVLIHLTGFDGRDLVVTSGAAFTVGPHELAAGQVATVKLDGDGAFRVFADGVDLGRVDGVSNADRDRGRCRTDAASRACGTHIDVVPSVADPGDDPTKMLAVRRSSNSDRAYRGSIRYLDLSGAAYTSNLLPLEDYVRGVVPRESPASWGALGDGDGIEALKAQAIAARSYAVRLADNRAANFITDACDTTSCQVYGGAAIRNSDGSWTGLDHSGANRFSAAAVAATAFEVRRNLDDGKVALTEFASSTGGYTAEASWTNRNGTFSNNVFGAVPDAGDAVSANPNDVWTTSVDPAAVIARGEASCGCELGSLERVEVTARNGLGDDGGRVREITIVGTAGRASLLIPNWSGDSFRRAFGLKSDWYTFTDFETSVGDGFWVGREDGAVAAYGSAAHHGDLLDLDLALNARVVDLAAHPGGGGYWLLGEDGGVFSFGASRFFGSTGDIRLNEPVVGMAAHPSGEGYWFVAADGGIFNYGAAKFHGSMGGIPLVSPVVGMAPTPSGDGYWLVAADGGIFSFGDAKFYGSIGGTVLNDPVVGMTVHPSGAGYWFVAADGGIFSYGASTFQGSTGDTGLSSPIVGMAAAADGGGYWLLQRNSLSHSFEVQDFPSSRFGADGAPPAVAIVARRG